MTLMVTLMSALLMQANPPIRVIESGNQSLIEDRQDVVARTDADWSAIWKQHAPDRTRPTVDFSREIVVAVFLGMRPTAGFAVEVLTASTLPDGALLVRYREKRPARDAVTAQVITAPYHIVGIPQPARPPATVRFERVD